MPWAKTVRQCDATRINQAEIERACAQFRGRIEQAPPLHSAIKVGGQKLYDIARAGGDVAIVARAVEISALEITRFFTGERPRAFLRVECSSGTYIRSLVRDIGRALDNAATMTFLTRVANGSFALDAAVTPEEFESAPVLLGLPAVLTNLMASFALTIKSVEALWQGKRVPRFGRGW